MKFHYEVGRKFNEQEFGKKLEMAGSLRLKEYEDLVVEKGDSVFYQTNNQKAQPGPARVTDVDKKWV